MTRSLPWWGRWLAIVALVAAAAGAGFASGRMSTIEQLDERVAVVEVRREHVVERWRKGKDRIVYVEKTTSPDGTVFERRSERETERAELARDVDRNEGRTEDRRSVTTSRPDWRVGVLIGATWKEPALPLGNSPVLLGLSVERRVVGPFFIGLWATTQGAGGAILSGEF